MEHMENLHTTEDKSCCMDTLVNGTHFKHTKQCNIIYRLGVITFSTDWSKYSFLHNGQHNHIYRPGNITSLFS